MTHHAPTLNQIREVRDRLKDMVVHTPVHQLSSASFLKVVGSPMEVFLKLELLQHGGSFKPRGVLNVMSSLSTEQLRAGVTAVSAGNHAIAVAYASKMMGVHAKIAMPKNAPTIRVSRAQEMGAEVVMCEDVHEAFDVAHDLEREGRFFVHPFEGPLVAQGTATVGLELCEAVPNLDAVIVPIGGGGLCAGVAAAVKQAQPLCKVYGVEPVGADSMSRSFEADKPMSIDKVRTIAASLGAPYALPYSYAICRQFVDDIVRVTDDEMCKALALLFHEAKLAVEPAGASATAALCGPLKEKLAGKRVGLIVCGANVDAATFTELLTRGESLS